jgi:hypothetical protein
MEYTGAIEEVRQRWPREYTYGEVDTSGGSTRPIIIPIGPRSGYKNSYTTHSVILDGKVLSGTVKAKRSRWELSYLCTFYKCQGITAEQIIIELNKRYFNT